MIENDKDCPICRSRANSLVWATVDDRLPLDKNRSIKTVKSKSRA